MISRLESKLDKYVAAQLFGMNPNAAYGHALIDLGGH